MADNTHCFDGQWSAFLVLAIPCAFIYALGIPLFFYLLIRKYKREGRLNDPDVKRMVGWLHEPFREGCEYWMSVEIIRKLLLTSCVGFMAQSPSTFCRTLFQIERAACTATACILIPAECSAVS